MTAIQQQHNDVKAFVNDLIPSQIRTALEFYLPGSSPTEELIAVSKTLFDMIRKKEIDQQTGEELGLPEERFQFWEMMCRMLNRRVALSFSQRFIDNISLYVLREKLPATLWLINQQKQKSLTFL